MLKKIIPAIFIVFTLFFSGKSISKDKANYNCGPYITFSNYYSMPVSQLVIQLAGASTITIDNPTFPYVYNFTGGHFTVTYYFSSLTAGTIQFYSPCDMTHFSGTSASTSFDAYCDIYTVDLINSTIIECE